MLPDTQIVDSSPKPRLLDQVRHKCRTLHYAKRTEATYVDWIRRFILFHQKRHPNDLGGPEIEAFLTHLAVQQHVAASTQNQALSALLFLYRNVLEQDVPLLNAVRAKKPKRLPVVLSVDEVRRLFQYLPNSPLGLMVELLYGTGMRLMECCRLRIKDLDFERRQIIVRDGKGEKDRAVPFPGRVEDRLVEQIQRVERLHASDVAQGYGKVWLPYALHSKYPNADRELKWQFVFPANGLSQDPRRQDGLKRRHHCHGKLQTRYFFEKVGQSGRCIVLSSPGNGACSTTQIAWIAHNNSASGFFVPPPTTGTTC